VGSFVTDRPSRFSCAARDAVSENFIGPRGRAAGASSLHHAGGRVAPEHEGEESLEPTADTEPGSGAAASLRALVRFTLIAVATAGLACVPLLALPFTLGRPRRLGAVRQWTASAWGATICRVLGVRIETAGEIPEGAVLFTPNHLGYLDLVVLLSQFRTFFLSRADLREWPLLGPASRIGGTLYIERSRRRDTRRATAEVEERLEDGLAVTVFLEGGAGDGIQLRPFRSSLLEAAVRTGVPCVPVALWYELQPDAPGPVSKVVAWADESPFLSHAWRLAGLRRVTARLRFLEPRTGTDRKALARGVESEIAAALADAAGA
jgi:1-acyl-sn-glycerol-3-phosphate acyltransferase